MTSDEHRARELAEQIIATRQPFMDPDKVELAALLLPLVRDQGRYQWLRDRTNHTNATEMVVNENIGHVWARVMDLDAAIDQARGET